MHEALVAANMQLVRQRRSEGDCPVTKPLSVETLEEMVLSLADGGWLPIATKPHATRCEERGEYRSDDGALWYFKPTHWRPVP